MTEITNKEKKVSSQHLVRKSFLHYLKNDFPYGVDWIHPSSKEVWSSEQIKDTLVRVKRLNPENYKVLWALWMTKETNEFIARRLCYSTTVIKKKWEKAINAVMILLLYPDLDDELLDIYND